MATYSRIAAITLLLATLGWLSHLLEDTASYADCAGSQSAAVSGATSAGALVVGVEQAVDSATCDDDIAAVDMPPRDSGLDSRCVQQAITAVEDPFDYCGVLTADSETPILTRQMVGAAFQRLPLPAADLVIQPPNGRTLVNFDTNFYTEQGEFNRTVTLLGQQVELRIWPERFVWRFGDGQVRETSSPGSPYPNLEITHSYRRKGKVEPSVDTTYAAQFRVAEGPWQDVDGTVTIVGSPQQLRVVTARPVLVGGRA